MNGDWSCIFDMCYDIILKNVYNNMEFSDVLFLHFIKKT